MRYVVFGVNIGNLDRSDPEGRPTSAELCRRHLSATEVAEAGCDFN
jgi:hypothetical protein